MMIKTLTCFLSLATCTVALAPGAANRRAFLQNAAAVTAGIVGVLPSNAVDVGGKPVFAKDDIMNKKSHGTSDAPVQSELLYGVNNRLADQISNFNRMFAEPGGSFTYTTFEDEVMNAKGPITFADSVTGKPLFVAPIGRSAEDFVKESKIHGEYLFLLCYYIVATPSFDYDMGTVSALCMCVCTIMQQVYAFPNRPNVLLTLCTTLSFKAGHRSVITK